MWLKGLDVAALELPVASKNTVSGDTPEVRSAPAYNDRPPLAAEQLTGSVTVDDLDEPPDPDPQLETTRPAAVAAIKIERSWGLRRRVLGVNTTWFLPVGQPASLSRTSSRHQA